MIKYKITNATPNEIKGTSLKGYIEATKQQLVDVLGEPTNTYESDKTSMEWHFVMIDKGKRIPITIYDYKDKYVGGVYTWHIGGKEAIVLFHISKLFPNNEITR